MKRRAIIGGAQAASAVAQVLQDVRAHVVALELFAQGLERSAPDMASGLTAIVDCLGERLDHAIGLAAGSGATGYQG